jgi:hypothetical protein
MFVYVCDFGVFFVCVYTYMYVVWRYDSAARKVDRLMPVYICICMYVCMSMDPAVRKVDRSMPVYVCLCMCVIYLCVCGKEGRSFNACMKVCVCVCACVCVCVCVSVYTYNYTL